MITSENQRQIKFKPRIKTEPQHVRCSLICKIDLGFSAEVVVGIEMSTMQKGCHFMGMSQHFCPSLSECKIVLLHTCRYCVTIQ